MTTGDEAEKTGKKTGTGTGEKPEVKRKPRRPGVKGYVKCPVPDCGAVVKSQGKPAHWRNNHDDMDYN